MRGHPTHTSTFQYAESMATVAKNMLDAKLLEIVAASEAQPVLGLERKSAIRHKEGVRYVQHCML